PSAARDGFAAAHQLRPRGSGVARAAAHTTRAAASIAAAEAACSALAWRNPFLFRLRNQEALIMARHRGRGIASVNYPIGMNLGGDPSQALVHSNPSG